MRKESKAKVAAAQRALDQCQLGKLTVSPYRSKIDAGPGHVHFEVIDPEKREIFVFLVRDGGGIGVYGEIGMVAGSIPCGITPKTAHYRAVYFDQNGRQLVFGAS